MTIKRSIIICALLAFQTGLVMAQNDLSHRFQRPLSDVIRNVEKCFGVKIKCGNDTVGKVLPYADFRIRPYSIEETLDNVCKYFDYNWSVQGPKSYRIKAYDYTTRRESDGRKMLQWLSSQYGDKASWELRRDSLRREARRLLQIDVYLDSLVKDGKVTLSKLRKYDGYTVQNLCIETLPGEHVFASIYAPAKYKKAPLILCPNGHFPDGRYRTDQQQRLGTLARMGAICVDYDLYAWGESALEHPAYVDAKGRKQDPHRTARAHVMQALNGIVLLNWMIENRGKNIDMARIGVNGGSGGGTQSGLLASIDDRITAAAPVVSLASHFDGGCPCESGMPIQLAGGGTCNAELLATFAPKPLLIVSDGGDWTSTVPTLEFPFMQRIWGFYGQEGAIRNVHLPDERHDFGPSKRNATYDFFIETFHLDRSKLDESKVTIEPYDLLKCNINQGK